MTWEGTLSALQALLGRRVVVWVTDTSRPDDYLPGGFQPISPLQVSGVLKSGEENKLIARVREALPQALSEAEEVIRFVLGEDQTEVDLTMTRSLFVGATAVDPDVTGVAITQGELVITVADQDEALEAASRAV